jgi:hypothetical protein
LDLPVDLLSDLLSVLAALDSQAAAGFSPHGQDSAGLDSAGLAGAEELFL